MAGAHSNDHSKGQPCVYCFAFNAPPLTYAHDVHEAVHAVADLEEQVLPLPLGRGAERRPHQPRDAGDEEERAEDDGGDLHLLDHRQRDGLPLKPWKPRNIGYEPNIVRLMRRFHRSRNKKNVCCV